MADPLGRRAKRLQGIDAGTEPRAAKLLRVLNTRGTSNEALRNIMAGLYDERAPGQGLVTDVAQARFGSVCKVLRLPDEEGGELSFECCDPNLLLCRSRWAAYRLQKAFLQALGRSPCTKDQPWSLVVGWDEHVPGNQLALQSSRKSMNLSFTFAELGDFSHNDVCWITPMVVQATKAHKVKGGWSAILREYLKMHLTSPGGLQSDAGVALTLGSQVHCLFARVRILLSDGDGLKQAFQWMGASSLKPCFRHWNVFKKESDRTDRITDRSLRGPSMWKFRAASQIHSEHGRQELSTRLSTL